MTSIAIIGFGTVGSSVFEIIEKKAHRLSAQLGEIKVKYIFDEKEITDTQLTKYITRDFQVILKDKEIDIVVEATNCVAAAYYYVKKLLLNNIKVVTSNKELVALHGAELTSLALENKTAFIFDACVCGSIPVITTIYQTLCINDIVSIYGIMNGTTNFMLTKMANEGASFEEALREAQDLGYAETNDPSNDTHGIDAARKIGILASIACGRNVLVDDMPVQGITKITLADIKNAQRLQGAIKLIAYAKINRENDTVVAAVEPMIVSLNNQLSAVSGVSNGVMLRCDLAGELMLCGPGAGGKPTASAVVSDIAHIINRPNDINRALSWRNTYTAATVASDTQEYSYYISVKNITEEEILKECTVQGVFSHEDGRYLVTKKITPDILSKVIAGLSATNGTVLNTLKIFE